MSIYTNDLQTLYVAYFNRPADPAGLAFWEAALASGRANLNTVRAAFAQDKEYKAAFANKTPTQIVTQVYLNLFGDQPDLQGLQFWVQKMAEGAVTIDTVVAEIAKGAQNEDRVAIQSKTQAAVVFTESLNTIDEINAYETAAGQTIAKNFLSGVIDAATLQAATTTANLNKITTDVVIAGNPGAAAVAAAKASYDTAAAAAATALTDATTKAAAATTAAAAVTAAQTAAATAQTKADATDAVALTAAAATAKTTADAAAAAKVTADANVVTAQAAFNAAVAAGDPVAVTTANGNLLIAQSRAATAATAATDAAAKLVTANAAAAAATADDAAAATAAAAITTAVNAATGAASAAVAAGTAATTAAAAVATAANGYVTAANGTTENADNVAAATAVSAAATAATNAAAAAASANAANAVVQAVLTEAQGQIEVAAALTAYNNAVTASATAAAATATAATAADAAIAGADSLEKANAAIAAANAQATAAAAQKTAADAIATAAAAYAAAAAKTANGADNTAATAAQAAATAATSAANAAVAAAQADVTAAAALPGNFVAKNITLTAGVDVEAGGAGADVFNAQLDIAGANSKATLTALDIVNGGAGVDTLNIVDLVGGQAIPGSVQIRSVEVINIRSAGATALDTTNGSVDMTGVTNVNVTQANGVTLTTGSTTALNVSGSRGSVTLNGGASQTVDAVTQSGKIDLAGSTGAVAVTSASQGVQAIEIDGGSTVSVTATAAATQATEVTVTGSTDNAADTVQITVGGKVFQVTGAFATPAAVATALAAAIDADAAFTATAAAGKITITSAGANTPFTIDAQATATDNGGAVDVVNSTSATTVSTGTINVGQTAAATGAVVINANLTSNGTIANATGGAVNVKGGSSITVNATATSNALNDDADGLSTIGAITAIGDGKTTSVTINQTADVNSVATASVPLVRETSVVTFSAIKAGETVIVNGLTFTAAKDLTASQVAQAFANLTRNDTQSQTGPVANGVYSGTFNTAAWTSAAASGATVTFTANDDQEADLVFTGTGTANDGATVRLPSQVKTAGTPRVSGDESVNDVAYGAVVINDAAAEAITSVTLNGYASANIGGTVGAELDKLATLSLANSGGAATVQSAATTMGLTLNNVKHAVNLDAGSATIATLNVTTTGADSAFALTADAVKDLTVSGTNSANLTGSALTVLENVTVTGSAGLNLGASVVAKSVTTTGTTGAVTATINGATATYAGGAGVDTVTTSGTTISKDINLGAGNDILNLAVGTNASSVVLNGGDGTDTLAMASADAENLSGSSIFETKFTSFERVRVNVAAGTARAVDIANLNDINYVIVADSAAVAPAAQVNTVTITGNTDNATDTVSITVGGTTFTTAPGVYTPTTAAAALAALIDADPAYTATAAAGVITVTGSASNTPFAVGTVTSTNNGGGADTITSTFGTTTAAAAGSTAQALTLNNFVNGGTLELTGGASSTTVALTDATGTADVLNIVTKVGANSGSFGTVAATGIETINITATDNVLDNNGDGANDPVNGVSLTLSDAALKNVIVTGNANVNLALNANVVALTSVDASALTGSLIATTNGTVAQTILGGSGADILTSNAAFGVADILRGGAGNDVLVAGRGMTTLEGGAGRDVFAINVASNNVNSAATIVDFLSGDTIDFAGATTFKSAGISLDSTAVFQDYANAAINSAGVNELAWFVFGGNTYIVMDVGANGTSFLNGTDMIVKITGSIDLSTASFNTTFGTLEMV